MVRSSVYSELGGLDERFFAHMEEIDLCWRMQLGGWKVNVVPESVVYHVGGGTLPAESPFKLQLNYRNNLLMLHKNLPDATRGRRLFRRRLLDTLAWAKFMATLDFPNARAVLRAHRDFRRMRRAYTAHPSSDLLASPSRPNILLKYYLQAKKRYSEI